MSELVIALDSEIGEALTTLAKRRNTTPSDLAAEIVSQYLAKPVLTYATDDEIRERIKNERPHVGPDPLDALLGSIDLDPVDALVGKYSGDTVNDIDAVVYDR